MIQAAFSKPPPGELRLGGGIHVWRFSSVDESILSEGERLQASKLQSAEAREVFLLARSGVRRAASIYSKIPPGDLLWQTNENGKPFFANAAVRFNLSHSGSTVVAAFSDSEVGVDIETRGRCRDFVAIANRFFHPCEAEAVSRARDEGQFLRLWTGKEAMLKLSGAGISGGLCDARPGEENAGTLNGNAVCLSRFSFDRIVGAVASFQPTEVKGWLEF
jgi:4'-phosphopantetheinyl transferase